MGDEGEKLEFKKMKKERLKGKKIKRYRGVKKEEKEIRKE